MQILYLGAVTEKSNRRSTIAGIERDHVGNLILLVTLIPMIFINLGSYHDWGGDFSLYIQQAINLIEGVNQSETHYVFNPYHIYLSPPSYGVGFPLLLAPVYAIFGNDIEAFLTFISIVLLLFLFLHFRYLRQRFNILESLIITGTIAYTPRILLIKGEVLSDIPFALFVCICLLLYSKLRHSKPQVLFFLIGLLVGFTMLIRSIGFLLILAFIIDQAVLILRDKEFGKKSALKNTTPIALAAFGCVLVYVAFGSIIFPAKQESFSFFSELFFTDPVYDQARVGLSYYLSQLEHTFNPEADKWQFLGILLKSFVIVMLILGMFNKFIKRPDFADYFFVMYMGVVLIFPVYSQGIRYLIPVFPIASGYIITGFRSFRFERKINKNLIYLICSISVYLTYEREVKIIDLYFPEKHKGPQTEQAIETFEFISNTTSTKDIIVFNKPRVLGLYTQRDSYAFYPYGNLNTTRSQLWDLGWNYVLTCTELPDPPMEEFLETRREEVVKVFTNEKFTLYRKK